MFALSKYVKGVTFFFFIEGIHKRTKGVKGLPILSKRLYKIAVRS